MFRDWRLWVLAILQLGPPAVFIVAGAFWLGERGWGFYGFLGWMGAAALFGILVTRWTRSRNPLLPPIDWEAPRTFSPRDRKAWELVQAEAERGEALPIEALTTGDIYVETGRRLAESIAEHFHPSRSRPFEHVAVVDILTALELAAEDLGRLCREVPGGDLVTPAHWRTAVQAAGYINKANEIYGYLLPFFQPAAGLMRLGTQKLMVQPAWKNMQQNLQRWFYRAYVNRLGLHLIELYSGRLGIGADQYRKLTGRSPTRSMGDSDAAPRHLVVAVAGARGAGKSALIEALDRARSGDLEAVRQRLDTSGLDETLAGHLRTAVFVEAEPYTVRVEGGEVARDRSTRRAAVEDATKCDLLLLVADGRRADFTPDARFAEAWLEWFDARPELETPPALAVLTGSDRVELGGEPDAPGTPRPSLSARQAVLGARLDTLRGSLPPQFEGPVAVGLGSVVPDGISNALLPLMAASLHRSERTSLIRHLQDQARRSKAGRFIKQVGKQSRRLIQAVRPGRKDNSR